MGPTSRQCKPDSRLLGYWPAGLPGWANIPNPSKPNRQSGARKTIQRERRITAVAPIRLATTSRRNTVSNGWRATLNTCRTRGYHFVPQTASHQLASGTYGTCSTSAPAPACRCKGHAYELRSQTHRDSVGPDAGEPVSCTLPRDMRDCYLPLHHAICRLGPDDFRRRQRYASVRRVQI